MSDYKISKLHAINAHGVTVKNKELYYNSRPLRSQTGLVSCPYGITEDGKLRVKLYPQAINVLHELDNIIKEMAEDLEHVPITFTDDELILTVSDTRTAFFDSNKSKITMDAVAGSEFTAYMLFDLSKPYIYEGKIKLSVMLLQVLVRTFCNLPPGCHIFNDLKSLRAHNLKEEVEEVKEVKEAKEFKDDLNPDVEPAETMDVNELLD